MIHLMNSHSWKASEVRILHAFERTRLCQMGTLDRVEECRDLVVVAMIFLSRFVTIPYFDGLS